MPRIRAAFMRKAPPCPMHPNVPRIIWQELFCWRLPARKRRRARICAIWQLVIAACRLLLSKGMHSRTPVRRWHICIAVYIRVVKYTATRYARKHIHPCARSALFCGREPVHAARSCENARPQRYTYVMHSYAARYAFSLLSTNPCNLPYVPLLLVHIAWADYVRST